MDDFARRRSADRTDLFRTVAMQRGLNATIIEKDFWVCWTLKRMFELYDPPAQLLFKGGTSLSKVFKAIERFSEDIDLSFNRSCLGFTGEADPLQAPTRKKRRRGLDALTDTCRRVIQENFLPALRIAFRRALGPEASERWSVEVAEDDPQAIIFSQPLTRRNAAFIRQDAPSIRPDGPCIR